MAPRDIGLRVSAALSALVLLPFALGGALLALAVAGYAAQGPDAFDIPGDPCCGTPDTWSAVLQAALLAIPAVAVAAPRPTCGSSFAVVGCSRRG